MFTYLLTYSLVVATFWTIHRQRFANEYKPITVLNIANVVHESKFET